MCVDRLEVGLKPACVAACLGNALNFGVIENTPNHREQIKTDIPGMPRTDITHPNIRFQQTASLPVEMTRTDSMAVKYHRDTKDSLYKPTVDKNKRKLARQWNLNKLRSREDPLVIFTLVTQAVIGAFMLLVVGSWLGVESIQAVTQSAAYLPLLFLLLGMESVALFLSTMHLGKPHRFYRAFNNLKYSPVSREVAGVAVFFNCLLGHFFFGLFDFDLAQQLSTGLACAGVVAGPVAIYFMHKIYRIAARPFWNHWQVLTAFYGSMLSLGSLLVALVSVPLAWYQGDNWLALLQVITPIMLAGLFMEGKVLFRGMSRSRHLATRS
jgi:DMSO reductase anchor subunit